MNYENIVTWMKRYFDAYNRYAQNPETVHRMEEYFTSDVQFIPYISIFGGPGNAVTNRDHFFKMFTGHPFNYEQFEVEEISVDTNQMVAVALLDVKLYDSETNELLLRKHYLPKYYLVMDENGKLKIHKILFFWEALPPAIDDAYGVERAITD